MHGDFRPLVNPGTPAHQVDIEGTRELRRQLNQAFRTRELLLKLIQEGKPLDDLVITLNTLVEEAQRDA